MLHRLAAVVASLSLAGVLGGSQAHAEGEPDDRLTATVAGGTHDTGRASIGGATTRGPHRFELDGAFGTTERTVDHQDLDANVAHYGGRWTLTRDLFWVDIRATGELQRLKLERPGATTAIPTTTKQVRARVGLRRMRTGAVEHELVAGVGIVRASGETADQLDLDTMQTHPSLVSRTLRGEHQFLTVYIDDTVRFIRGIDITTGLVVEEWRNLGGDSTITYGSGPSMESETPDAAGMLVSPSVGVVGHLDDEVAIAARSIRGLRAPTLTELYRPSLVGGGVTAANPALRPETVWTTEVGPQLQHGRIEARASAYVSSIENAIASVTLDDSMEDGAVRQRENIGHARIVGGRGEARWRPASSWLATVAYVYARSQTAAGRELAQTPRHVATAVVTYDNDRVVTVTGAVRYAAASYIDDRNTRRAGDYALVDAVAVRKLGRRVRGFVGVDNLLDRRYLLGRGAVDTFGAARTVHFGVTIGMP